MSDSPQTSNSEHDELVDALQQAAAAVDAAGLAPELRAAGFVLAFGRILAPVRDRDRPRQRDGNTSAAPTASAGRSSVGSIARALNVDEDSVSRVFDVDDEGVHLIVPRRLLEAGRRPATRQLALLLVAGRQAAGLEEWTSLNAIREACEHYGVYDSGNFSTDVRALDGLRIRGQGAAREVKATLTALEAAGAVVASLATRE